MELEITSEQLQNLNFRKNRLENRLRKLKDLLSGGETSFLPMVRDEKGQFSETRTWALIEQLLDAFRTHLRLQVHAQEPVLSQEDEMLYQSFLYCAIRYAECPPTWESDWYVLPGAKGVYSDLLHLAENLDQMELADLLFYESYQPPDVSSFFAFMNEIYNQVSSTDITQTYSEEDTFLMMEAHGGEINNIEEQCREMADIEWDWSDIYGYEDDRTPEEIEEDEALLEQWKEERYLNGKAKESWKSKFAEKESFCRQYLIFRKAYYSSPARQVFAQNIGNLLEMFLLLRGASNFLDDDTFFSTLTMLGKVSKFLQQNISNRG